MNELINETIEFIKRIFKDDFSGHDLYHTLRVLKLALKLAEQEKADKETVAFAALLHDVDDKKLSPKTAENKDRAVNYLKSKKFSAEKINGITKIIDEISFRGTDSVTPSSIEGKCVQDADRLDALGAIGIARAFAYGGSRNRPLYDPETPPETNLSAEEYFKNNSSSINHFYEKLFLLKDLMNTKTGKEIAEERTEFMKVFVAEFLKEWDV